MISVTLFHLGIHLCSKDLLPTLLHVSGSEFDDWLDYLNPSSLQNLFCLVAYNKQYFLRVEYLFSNCLLMSVVFNSAC